MVIEALNARGLAPFFAKSSREAAERMRREVAGVRGPTAFDPLTMLTFMILTMAIEILGIESLIPDNIPQNEVCAVCVILKVHDTEPCEHGCSHDDVENRWIERPAEVVLEHVNSTPELAAYLESKRV